MVYSLFIQSLPATSSERSLDYSVKWSLTLVSFPCFTFVKAYISTWLVGLLAYGLSLALRCKWYGGTLSFCTLYLQCLE